jgi:hypothetical protein
VHPEIAFEQSRRYFAPRGGIRDSKIGGDLKSMLL